MQQQQEEEIYYCKTHNEIGIRFDLKDNLESEDRIQCQICLIDKENLGDPIKIITLKEKIQAIKKNQNQMAVQYIQESINQIEIQEEQINQANFQLNQIFSIVTKSLQSYKNELILKIQNALKINIFEDYILLKQNFKEYFISEIYKLNRNNQAIIKNSMNDFLNKSNQIMQDLEQKFKSFTLFKKAKFHKMININQKESCLSLAFNKNDTILATGHEDMIKLWNVEDQNLLENTILKPQGNCITCVVFSKQYNWLISSEELSTKQGQITLWKEKNLNNWEPQSSEIIHKNKITSLILNKDENQLFSSSQDNTINIWNINYEKNEIHYKETLLKHTQSISCIILNDIETHLISCSCDKSIIIWIQQNQKWICWQTIITNDYGYKLCFLDNYQFIWQQRNSKEISIFQFINQEYQNKRQLQFEQIYQLDHFQQFPSSYNKKQKLLLHKYANIVFLIKQNEADEINVEDLISLNSQQISGALSNNGKLAIIYNSQQLQMLKIINDYQL